MANQQGPGQMHNDPLAAETVFQNEGSHQEDPRPHYMESNEPSPSKAQPWVDPDKVPWDKHDDDDLVVVDRVLVDHSEVSASGPSSESTASDDTIVNHGGASTPQLPALPGTGLTMDNMALHDRIQPLGTMSTYEWLHGRRCPGDFDLKDISSKDSIKARPCQSRVSQSTTAEDDDIVVVNHPSEAFVTGVGGWADVSTPVPYTIWYSLI